MRIGLFWARHLALRRREWLQLPDTEARVSQLEALLVEHVPLRRQPVLQDPCDD